eukprot:snap_masked-scaffold_26-processed-gene-2.13-mRNA-1 protein AED:1.00 eAED:1.00 QI:0/0/0/0/1/1/2/0/260
MMFSIIFSAIVCHGWITGLKCNLLNVGFKVIYGVWTFHSLFMFPITLLFKIYSTDCIVNTDILWYWGKFLLFFGIPISIASVLLFVDQYRWKIYDKESLGFNAMFDVCLLLRLFPSFFFYLRQSFDRSTNQNVNVDDGVTLELILKDMVLRRVFQRFLVETFCFENLAFLKQVELFQKASLKRREKQARFIVKHFIDNGAAAEINLPHHIREDIKHALSLNYISAYLFYAARDEITQLLKLDSLPKFKAHRLYTEQIIQS